MKLKVLLKDLPAVTVKGSREIAISGVTANSKVVAPGNVFIARRGANHDGSKYIPEAIEGGAVAIVTDMYDPSLKGVTQIIVEDTTECEIHLATVFYRHASEELFLVGVTGTNGKTTTTLLIKQMLDALNRLCGVIGTIEYIIGPHRYAATRTTPDVVTNHKFLREMVEVGCAAGAMEVTSHGLALGRVSGITFDVGIFTNLGRDHLDFHKTMEEYAEAKSLIFKHLKRGGIAVVAAEDPWTPVMMQNYRGKSLTFGIGPSADINATDVQLRHDGASFVLSYGGQSAQVDWSLIGRFNILNGLAAASALLVKGIPVSVVAERLCAVVPIEGRCEPVPNALGIGIYVDYAHKPEALEQALNTMRLVTKGRVIVLFGCGGDRDAGKRPIMGSIAERLADLVVVTSDNPRSEDPAAIIGEIIGGVKDPSKVVVEHDRKAAILAALQSARPGDVVLIAGKGHERSQTIGMRVLPFDDVLVAAACAEELAQAKV